jgi:hypothetical protein
MIQDATLWIRALCESDLLKRNTAEAPRNCEGCGAEILLGLLAVRCLHCREKRTAERNKRYYEAHREAA